MKTKHVRGLTNEDEQKKITRKRERETPPWVLGNQVDQLETICCVWAWDSHETQLRCRWQGPFPLTVFFPVPPFLFLALVGPVVERLLAKKSADRSGPLKPA